MVNDENIRIVSKELETGIGLAKCQKCGCMREALDSLAAALPTIGTDEANALAQSVAAWNQQMRPVQYSCLGCAYCYPAAAQNVFAAAFANVNQMPLVCDFQVHAESWPSVVGEYFVLDPNAHVAVSTLGSTALAEELAQRKPNGLAIVGKTETENIGLDKIVKNIVTNHSIQFLIVAGNDPAGHQSGQTLRALAENGIDANGRVIGSLGKRPILRNVSTAEINAFRKQVQVINLIGCEDAGKIVSEVETLSPKEVIPCGCGTACEEPSALLRTTVPRTVASDSTEPVVMDKAGYFVILPLTDRGIVAVEHYAYDNTLLHVVEGTNARALYKTFISNGWVSELSHAAYLGKELAKAELSLKHGFKYVQDGA